MNFARYYLFLLIYAFTNNCFGQYKFSGRMLSIIDSTPLQNIYFRVESERNFKTDSLGFFSFEYKKQKVKIEAGILEYKVKAYLSHRNEDFCLYTIAKCDSILAEFEFYKNKSKLFCGVGFLVEAMMNKDYLFQKRFGIDYYLVGCVIELSIDDMTNYNIIVSKKLDFLYGKIWRKNLRNDVLGLRKKVGS